MKSTVAKLAPTGSVLLFALYWGWCTLDQDTAPAAGAAKTPDESPLSIATVARNLAPTRDPFRPLPDPTAAESAEPEPEEEPEPPVDLLATLQNIHLSATILRGDRRSALIDGHLYAVGDGLNLPGVPNEACVIMEILPDRVTVEGAGQRVELTYARPESTRQRGNARRPSPSVPSPAPSAPVRSPAPAPPRAPSQGVLR